ncbi:hypothetical protein [Fervidibacillus halotolerans]|uniref:Uncharacterized protein n=1 Tax=Fervidibacillus halotolerans TaxID=2980027 RepID=A0A9E8M0G1_9BACI|nr:hypothetical protein [Fervidibacillus halotolerans]WAA13193.1 hypothetical protein OE105_03425 [Fervidibacillus halotolerans]
MSKVLESFFSYLLSNARIIKPENVSKEEVIQEIKAEISEIVSEWKRIQKENENEIKNSTDFHPLLTQYIAFRIWSFKYFSGGSDSNQHVDLKFVISPPIT